MMTNEPNVPEVTTTGSPPPLTLPILSSTVTNAEARVAEVLISQIVRPIPGHFRGTWSSECLKDTADPRSRPPKSTAGTGYHAAYNDPLQPHTS